MFERAAFDGTDCLRSSRFFPSREVKVTFGNNFVVYLLYNHCHVILIGMLQESEDKKLQSAENPQS